MAVTITTSFYEYDTPDWHDLSTVVFTSPNLGESPQTAGTRSHILPGESNLATWYEVTGDQMWLIFKRQVESVESFYPASANVSGTTVSGFDIYNSIVFELTAGENYNNRVTAWDSVTHNSTDNYLIDTERVKASCSNYSWGVYGIDTEDDPSIVKYGGEVGDDPPYDPLEPFPPQYNITLKGNTTTSGIENYYGDFDMIWTGNATSQTRRGDYLIVRPWLYDIDSSVPYGNHDFVITLHYSYT